MSGKAAAIRARREAMVVAAALSVAVLLAAFHRALPQLHALNFSTAGPGPSAALVLLLVGGWTIPLAAGGGAGRRPALLAATAGVALAASYLPHPLLATLAGLACFPLLAPGLAALAQGLGGRVGAGFAAGVLVHQALRSLVGGAPLAATPTGRLLGGVLAAASIGAWIAVLLRVQGPELPSRGLADGAPLLVAVLVEAAFLGSAEAPATWMGSSRLLVALGSAAGLALGGLAAANRWSPRGRGRWAWGLLLGLAALDLVLWGWAAGLSVGLVQLGLVLLVGGAATRRPTRSAVSVGLRTSAVQGLAVVLLVGLVWAGNWAFVPVGASVRGRAGPLLAALVLLPGLVALRPGAAARRWVE